MNSLTIHELKKLLSKRILIIGIVFFLLANAFNIYQTNDMYRDKINSDVDTTIRAIYKTVEGPVDSENVARLYGYRNLVQDIVSKKSSEKTIFFDYPETELAAVTNILSEIEKTAGYSDKIGEILSENAALMNIYKEKGNDYLVKTGELVSKTYSGREIKDYYDVKTYEKYLEYDFSSFLILLLVFLATASLYAGEKESGMMSLMRSTPMGRVRLSNAKQTAVLIFTAALCALFYLSDFLMFLWTIKLCGGGNPLYSIAIYEFTPLVISIGGFALLCAVLKYFGFVCFVMISCVISSIMKKSYMVFAADLLVCMALMLFSAYGGGVIDYLNLFNPLNMLTCREMFFTFDAVNVFGIPVFRYYISFICTAAAVCGLSALTSLLNNANARAGRCGK